MGVFSVLGSGTRVIAAGLDHTGAKDSGFTKGAKDFANYFKGSYTITLGCVYESVYGYREEHIYTDDVKLNVGGSALGLKALLGGSVADGLALLNRGGLDFIGAGGNANFTYGSMNQLVYGGPWTTFRRGPRIQKASNKPLADNPLFAFWSADIPGELDATALEIKANDGQTATVIRALSVLLIVSTAALELALRFAYPEYGPVDRTYVTEGDADREKEDVYHRGKEGGKFGVSLAAQLVPSIIMGLIYGIEMAGSFTEWVIAVDKAALKNLNFRIPLLAPSRALKALKQWAKEHSVQIKNALEVLALIVWYCVVIGIAIALALR